jgi:hypothetical protein
VVPAVLYHEGKTGSGEFLVSGYGIKKHWYDRGHCQSSHSSPEFRRMMTYSFFGFYPIWGMLQRPGEAHVSVMLSIFPMKKIVYL